MWGPSVQDYKPIPERTHRYRLEIHPTTKAIPVAIWDCPDPSLPGCMGRLVCILKGDASATFAEAKIMCDALNREAEND